MLREKEQQRLKQLKQPKSKAAKQLLRQKQLQQGHSTMTSKQQRLLRHQGHQQHHIQRLN